MRVIVEGNKKDIDILIRENRIRMSRGLLSFTEVSDDGVHETPKAKVEETPKAKLKK